MLMSLIGYFCIFALAGQVILGSTSVIKPLRNVTAIEGQDVVLRCQASGIGPRVSRSWTKNQGDVIYLNSQATRTEPRIALLSHSNDEYAIQIRNVSVKDEGSYTCSVYAEKSQQATLHLSVNVPPRMVQVTEDLVVDEGSHVQLSCIAAGKPAPEISWRHLLPSADEIRGTNHALPLGAVTRGSAGIYECTADNGVSSPVTKYIQLTVNYPPQMDLDEVATSIKAPVGNSAKLKCVAVGVPEPTITWYHASGKDAQTMSQDGRFSVVNLNQGSIVHSELFISSVTGDDFGNWSCLARNSLGLVKQPLSISKKNLPPTRLPPYVVFGKSRIGRRSGGDDNASSVVLARYTVLFFELFLVTCLVEL